MTKDLRTGRYNLHLRGHKSSCTHALNCNNHQRKSIETMRTFWISCPNTSVQLSRRVPATRHFCHSPTFIAFQLALIKFNQPKNVLLDIFIFAFRIPNLLKIFFPTKDVGHFSLDRGIQASGKFSFRCLYTDVF